MALIGALLLNASIAWPAVADVIEPEYFSRADSRVIFAAVAELMTGDSPPEGAIAPVVADRLSAQGELDAAGGRDYLARLIEETPSSSNARSYALAVRDAADRRRWADIGARIAAAARDGSAESAAQLAAESAEEFGATLALHGRADALEVEPMAAWSERPAPPPRDWIMEGFVPAARVTSLFGNGGLGKTLLAMQIGLHVSMGRALFDTAIVGGPVLGIFCEDEQDELERRGRSAATGQIVDLADVDGFYPLSRDGKDSYLCSFEHDRIKLTRFYHELEATIESIGARLVILDTAADLFAGDFMSTPHVRQFIKIALGGLCTRQGCAILLLAHPSQSAMSTGDGGGFSTAWNNSVRSRLYLRRPKADDPAEAMDRRVLQVMKSNYAADGGMVPLVYENGYFVLDHEPIDESAGVRRKPEMTQLSFAIHTFMREHADIAVPFGQIENHLLKTGVISGADKPATNRKKVQRALEQLRRAEIVRKCEMPRGTYRLTNNEVGADGG